MMDLDSQNIFYDLNRVPDNGFLVFPLSMSRLYEGQSPQELYDFIRFFKTKICSESIDVIFIYTNGLYCNAAQSALSIRRKTIAQMVTHKQELWKTIKQDKTLVPKAFHFMAWDDLIIKSFNYLDLYSNLKKLCQTNHDFKRMIEYEIGSRDLIEENYEFIIEETLLTYLIRQKFIALPSTLSHSDGWRLIVYPGMCLMSDVYLHQYQLLPENKELLNLDHFSRLASHARYHMQKQILLDYDKIIIKDWVKPVNHLIINPQESYPLFS